jgi:HEAT repeat protein
VSSHAVSTLGAMGDARAVEPLIAHLADSYVMMAHLADSYVMMKQEIPKSLAKIGLPAVDALLTALKDRNGGVRCLAAETLGMIGDARAIAPLISALNDDDAHVRHSAVKALGNLGNTTVVEALIAALQGDDKYFQLCAITALGKIGDSRAAEPLIAFLGESDREIRQKCVEALEKIGWQPRQDMAGAYYWAAKQDWKACLEIGAAALQPLLVALRVGDWDVRQHAAEALGVVGDTSAVEPLITALEDKSNLVRRNAANALISLYQAGKLDERSRQQVLSLREKMSQPHVDNSHECGGHTDRGIGVDFPL